MARKLINKRIFTYDEALETFPLVRDLTAAAVRRLDALESNAGPDEVEEAREKVFRAWAQEILALGCEVKGLWLVDWDMGDGYYCWRHPEQAISFFHTYDEGFAGRIPIN
ncbi:MAG TPA: DUF2203 family protein [Thermoanaerobaculia bacterium]